MAGLHIWILLMQSQSFLKLTAPLIKQCECSMSNSIATYKEIIVQSISVVPSISIVHSIVQSIARTPLCKISSMKAEPGLQVTHDLP